MTFYQESDFQSVRADQVQIGDLIGWGSQTGYYACPIVDATLVIGPYVVLDIAVIPGQDTYSHRERELIVSWEGTTPTILARMVYEIDKPLLIKK